MAYGPQIPGLDKGGSGVNLAAPGAIGGTTAGSGAFTELTASSNLAVTGSTTLTNMLYANYGITTNGQDLLITSAALSDYSGSSTLNLGSNGPNVNATPIAWIKINDAFYGSLYMPVWGSPP